MQEEPHPGGSSELTGKGAKEAGWIKGGRRWMWQRQEGVKGPLSDEQVGTSRWAPAGGRQAQGLPLPTNGERILRRVRDQDNTRKVRCSWREGTAWRATWRRNVGAEAPGTEQGSESPRGQRDGGDGGRQGRVAGGSVCPGECPEVSLPRLAQSSCWAPTCLLQGGCSGGGLQTSLGLARCGLQRVRQGGSSSAGIGGVGQLARGGQMAGRCAV